MPKVEQVLLASVPFIKVVAGTVALSLFCADHVGYPGVVRGNSMLPSLHGSTTARYGDVVWLRKTGLVFPIERGAVVVLRSPENPKKFIIKRVLAMEGDCVATDRGKGKPLVVPHGHVWVEGDNTTCSRDSTHLGPVPTGLVLGRASHIIWPPSRFGTIPPIVPSTRPRPALVGQMLRSVDDWQEALTDDQIL